MRKSDKAWFRLDENFFENVEMLLLRDTEDGYHCMIVYLKLLMLADGSNNVLYGPPDEKKLAEELSVKMEEDEGAVYHTICFLMDKGLMEKAVDGRGIYLLHKKER